MMSYSTIWGLGGTVALIFHVCVHNIGKISKKLCCEISVSFVVLQNIVQRIGSFTQKASESVCILSASGSVSSAEILRPGSFGGVLRYEVCIQC